MRQLAAWSFTTFALAASCTHDVDTHSATRVGSSEDAALATRVDDYLRRWEAFGFSGAVLVGRTEGVLLRAGYGHADRGRGQEVTPETVFDIGSVSKQFTAAAILRLVELGRLRVEDTLGAVLTDVPEDKDKISIHHLLTHTSGVGDFGKEADLESRDELLTKWLAHPLFAEPGSTYDYSNLGYSVLAGIVEIVSGMPFERFLHEELFEPAGMESTGFSWEGPGRWTDRSVALGYGGFTNPCGGEDSRHRPDGWRLRGAGNVLSTLDDLWRWDQALFDGRVLSPRSLSRLTQAHTVAEASFLSYGYGWRLQETPRQTRVVWHSGLDGAFSSMYRRYVDEDLVVLFLSNYSIDGTPVRDILIRPAREGALGNLLFGGTLDLPPRPSAPAMDGERLGSWQGPDRSRFRLEQGTSGPRLRAESQSALDVIYPPADEEALERAARASKRAQEAARALLDGDLEGAARVAGPIDPFGYSRRDLAAVLQSWREREAKLGALQRVEAIASGWVRRGPRDRLVTHIRLHYEHKVFDEHFLWYADDEVYSIPCAPEATSLPLRALDDQRLLGFDPVSRGIWTISLDETSRTLNLSAWRR